MDDLRARSGTSTILITCDSGVAADCPTRSRMRQGRLVEVGPTRRCRRTPARHTRRSPASVPARSSLVRDRPAGQPREPEGDPGGHHLRRRVRRGPRRRRTAEVHRGETFDRRRVRQRKSTSSRVLSGLTEATSGRVRLLGTDVTSLTRKEFRVAAPVTSGVATRTPTRPLRPALDVADGRASRLFRRGRRSLRRRPRGRRRCPPGAGGRRAAGVVR